MREPLSIVITGASSGLGAALARAYAAPGVSLALTGRDKARLAETVAACRARGAAVAAAELDVTDAAAMAQWLAERDAAAPVDLVIANAGVSGGTGGGGEGEAQVRAIFSINLGGVLNTVLPLIPALRRRRRGQIAIMSSLAGFLGFAGAPAYSASKAAVKVWGEGLRGALGRDGIAVSVICPGFIESRMTAGNAFPMPFLMPADRAAAIIRRGLARGRARIAFPWPLYALVWLSVSLPAGLTGFVTRRLPEKA